MAAKMEEARTNTLRIFFGPGKSEPSDHAIFQFLRKKMNLVSGDLLAMYKEPKEHCVYVKFQSETLLKDTLHRLPSSMEFCYDENNSTTVTISVASTIFKYVRVFNLPPEIEDRELSEVFSKFGTIQRMVREKYASDTGFPIWTSVRGIHMDIKKEVPSTIHVRNFQARVYYDGLLNKCFVCGSSEHMKANCPKRVTANYRLNTVRYSDIVAGPSRVAVADSQKVSIAMPKPLFEIGVGDRNATEKKSEIVDDSKQIEKEDGNRVGGKENAPENQYEVLETPEETEGLDGDVMDEEEEANTKTVSERTKRGRIEIKADGRTESETSTESESGAVKIVPSASISLAQSMLTRGRSKSKQQRKH